MADSITLRIGDKVRITEHSNSENIAATGILLSAQKMRPAIDGQIIKEEVCKVKLDSSGEIADCLLRQLTKV